MSYQLMVYGGSGIVGGNGDGDVSGGVYWTKRANPVLDSVSGLYSELIVFFFSVRASSILLSISPYLLTTCLLSY